MIPGNASFFFSRHPIQGMDFNYFFLYLYCPVALQLEGFMNSCKNQFNIKRGKESAFNRSFFLLLLVLIMLFAAAGSYAQPLKSAFKLGPQLLPENFKVKSNQGKGIQMYDPVTGNLNTSCPNSNFSNGNWNGWTGCYGYGTIPPLNSCQVNGMITGPPYPTNYTAPLHKIMTSPSHIDYWSCGIIPTVFPGESFSARLGDTSTGRHGAELHYDIFVNDSNYLFVYRYAVVLESPNHSTNQQPSFQVVIRDSVGVTLDPVCGYYSITAPAVPNAPPPGWTFCNTYGRDRYARPWTTVGMDLTPYAGRHITLAFIAKGCCIASGSHRGYAFVSAYCSSLILQTAMCQGDTSATLTAPPGFAHYLWSNGDTTESITVPHPLTGETYSCTLTAFNSCSVTLTITLTYTVVNANFTYTPNCPGYTSQFHDISTVNQNQVISRDWSWGDGTSATTTSLPNTTHIFPNPGTFNVTMIAHSTEGCTDTIVKSITIDTLALLTNIPLIKTICSGDHINLTLTSNVTGTGFTWTASPQYSATTTGYHDNLVPTAFLNDTLFNSGLLPDTVEYLIHTHNNTCISNGTIYRVVVLPKPTLANSVLSQSVCSGSPSTAVYLVPLPGPPSVVNFNWTAYPSSPLLSGYTASATGSLTIPVQTIINNTGVPQYVDDSITPLLQAANACPGDKKVYRIHINPLPTPVITGPPSVCANSAGAVYSTPNAANHDYLWTVTGASGFTGNHTSAITVNWGAGPTGTVQVEDVDQSLSTNCSATTQPYNVTINPNPTPVITGNHNPCGLSTETYTVGSPQNGHSYAWTVTGGIPATGTGTSITVTWGNINPVSISVVETIAYSGGVNCPASAPAFRVTLITFPLAAGPISGPADVCNTWSRSYSVGTITNSDSYTWWYTPAAGVTLTNNGTNADLAFDLTATSGSLYVKGNKTGCGSGPASPAFAINLHALPVVSLTSCNDAKTTTSARPFYLKGGLPPGGQYFIDGTVLPGGLLTPSALMPVVHQITYQYTNIHTCSNFSLPVSLTVLQGSFLPSCPYTFTDSRNSRVYHAALMGGRCWMIENLDYGSKLIPDNQPQTDNCIAEKYCSTSDLNCTSYGGLYQWDELMLYGIPASGDYLQGLCPPEWHVPTTQEWQGMIDSQVAAGNGIAGGSLKDPNPVLGFNAVLLGLFYQNNQWDFTSGALKGTMYWTATTDVDPRVVVRGLNSYNQSVSTYNSLRSNAFPVRCVKDF